MSDNLRAAMARLREIAFSQQPDFEARRDMKAILAAHTAETVANVQHRMTDNEGREGRRRRPEETKR